MQASRSAEATTVIPKGQKRPDYKRITTLLTWLRNDQTNNPVNSLLLIVIWELRRIENAREKQNKKEKLRMHAMWLNYSDNIEI